MDSQKITVLLSRNIFPATSPEDVLDGFVALHGNKIAAVGPKEAAGDWVSKAEKVYDLGDRVVTPGFTDVHTFFSGYLLQNIGIDFSGIISPDEGIRVIREFILENPRSSYVFGHGWNPGNFPAAGGRDILSDEFPSVPIVIFSADRGNCWMNRSAAEKYKFTPDECYAEMIWRMMPEYLREEGIEDKYVEYLKKLNARGITTIKEIGFDDYYGFSDTLAALENEGRLTARVAVISQPVGEPINIAFGQARRSRFTGDYISFQGYNRMTDRGIARFLGDLIEPYASRPDITCMSPVDYEMIEKETLAADRAGFRYSLHCQGDGAVRKTLDILEKCEKVGGRLKHRHAITDLEYSNPADLERMGRLGVIAEIYAQIQSLDRRDDILAMIEAQLGGDRGKNYWNRRKMWDSGVVVSCGTDLPLLFPDIPEGIYCGCGGYFSDGGDPFNVQNMMTIGEMLIAWTRNGQINCCNDLKLGTLEAGKLADIAVLDSDVFHMPMEEMRNVNVCLTFCNGEEVYCSL